MDHSISLFMDLSLTIQGTKSSLEKTSGKGFIFPLAGATLFCTYKA